MSSDYPVPLNEPYRQSVLETYNILDTPREEEFDRITRLAVDLFNVPIALVTLLDRDRQWIKACYGFDSSETSRESAFCTHAILADSVLVIEDALDDPRFAGNPLVLGPPYIRFYAGAPLKTRSGLRLGTLCVIDTKPRDAFAEADQRRLSDLACILVDAMELRLRLIEDRQERHNHRNAAEAGTRAKQIFLDLVGHELRTPLNAIIGFSDLIAGEMLGPIENAEYVEYARSASEGGRRLLHTATMLLTLANAEAGELLLTETSFSISKLVSSCVRLMAGEAAISGITLETSVELPGSVLLRADEGQSEQIILQLISNAVQHAPRGTTAAIEVWITENDDLALRVRNESPKMSPGDVVTAMEPFSQVSSGRERSKEGLGVGLPLTRRLMALHGGTLDFEASDDGHRAQAVAQFPAWRVKQERE